MAVEIERKFLARNISWKEKADAGTRMTQSYLCIEGNRVIRIRITEKHALLGFKFASSLIRRKEFEYEIPLEEAREIVNEFSSRPPLEKTRYRVPYGRHIWEVDVFSGANEGLTVAEIELAAEDEVFDKPDWIGEEVTWDERYLNFNLFLRPIKEWE